MNIKIENPPIMQKILEVFPDASKPGVIFCWGDIIYNPTNAYIPPELIEHEKVHQKQQNNDPISWWEKYLVDVKFRFDQELPAHQAEYKEFCRLNKDRNRRALYLKSISERLASTLYGNIVSVKEAKEKILKNH